MCANLAKHGRSVATVSEGIISKHNAIIGLLLNNIVVDLDTIAFGDAPILRYFFSRGRPILSIDPIIARRELGITRKAFIDLCILCGTDFSGTIQGIGPHKALEVIRKHGSIEQVLANLEARYSPQDTFNYALARQVGSIDEVEMYNTV